MPEIDPPVFARRTMLVVIPPESVSNRRGGMRPAELQRPIRGDLDAIVMNVLYKEPEHRCRSVEELSDDIERHLTGMTVKARQGSRLQGSGRSRHMLQGFVE